MTVEAFVRQQIKSLEEPKDNIVQFWPDKSRDFNSFLVAGSEKSIKDQILQLSSIYQFGLDWFGVPIDLDRWMKDFENCFPEIVDFEYSEYRDKSKPWGEEKVRQRPQFRRLRAGEEARRGYAIVEFYPAGRDGGRAFILSGPPMMIMLQANLIMAQHQQLTEYDIGQWVGYPTPEYLKNYPRHGLALKLMLRSKEKPPYGDALRREVNVPYVKKSAVNYQNLRDICGGSGGIRYGEHLARAWIGEGREISKLTQVVSFGSSEEVAKSNLKRFVGLSSLPLRRIRTSKASSEGASPPSPDDLKSFSVYPAHVVILNQKLADRASVEDRTLLGRSTSAGRQFNKLKKLTLHEAQKPEWWDGIKDQVLEFSNQL